MQTDASGLILRANQTFCEWVGRDCAALIGKVKLQDLFTIGGKIFHQTHWLPLLQLQQSVAEVKFDLVHRDGTTVPILLNAIRRPDAHPVVHDIAAFVARDRDRYEREIVATGKRLAEMADASAKLEELAKDRALFAEQMLGIVSHDLRNPLAVIDMSTLVIESMGLTPAQQQMLDRINRASGRANRMIRDLLDFTQARIGQGIAVQIRPIDLPAVLAESVDDLRHAYPDNDLIFEFDGFRECEADADRMTQLVGNLVTNAIAYGAPNRPIIIRTSISPDRTVITVHNEGRPIPAETLALIFQPMTRGHQGPNGGRSVGLGLYIVREIAKAHGGDISVTSTAESGTTFNVSLPRSRNSAGWSG